MKVFALTFVCMSLAGCAIAYRAESQGALGGNWFSGNRLNKTDYVLSDCVYEPAGTFKCRETDRGCAGKFCEAHEYGYSGIWRVEASEFVRECTSDWCEKGVKRWKIVEARKTYLLFEDGVRWFRDERQRDSVVLGAL